MDRLNFHRPVKQRRALLESNPPRDSWIERRRNKSVSTFGEAETSPKCKTGDLYFRALSMPQKTQPKHVRNKKTTLARTRFFEASATPIFNAVAPYAVLFLAPSMLARSPSRLDNHQSVRQTSAGCIRAQTLRDWEAEFPVLHAGPPSRRKNEMWSSTSCRLSP